MTDQELLTFLEANKEENGVYKTSIVEDVDVITGFETNNEGVEVAITESHKVRTDLSVSIQKIDITTEKAKLEAELASINNLSI